MRDIVFISHSNPEDNIFAKWLALKLAAEGYKTWCDVMMLIGGEHFWNDIDDAIRNYSCKFIFILSQHSNSKNGTISELTLATAVARKQGLRDFVIPIRIDDIGFSDVNVLLQGVTVIDASINWGIALQQLLLKLARDNTPTICDYEATGKVISDAFHASLGGNNQVLNKPEALFSNWFSVKGYPEMVYVHHNVSGPANDLFPSFPISDTVLMSFSPAADLGITCSQSITLPFEGDFEDDFVSHDLRYNAISNMLSLAFENRIFDKLRVRYLMSNAKSCFYFNTTNSPAGCINFLSVESLKGRRQLVGRTKNKYWHYGISSFFRNSPFYSFAIRGHVIFSDDGITPWEDSTRQHRSRRSVCKAWWNGKWRDLLLVSMSFLSDSETVKEISLKLSPSSDCTVSTDPIVFYCPKGYNNKLSITIDDPIHNEQGADEEL